MIWDRLGNLVAPDRKFKTSMPFSLFKYIKHDYSIKAIQKKEITFVSPNLWTDPFEYSLYNSSYNIYCMCASVSRSKNEESFWSRVAPSFNGNHVMWSINFLKLLEALKDAASKCGIKFYIAPIDYSASKRDIQRLVKTTPKSLENQISRLCIKRVAFAHECEIRIFAVVEDNTTNNPRKDLLNIPVDLLSGTWKQRVLTKVVLPPFKPSKKGVLTPAQYDSKQRAMNNNKRVQYQNEGLKGSNDIEQCRLYQVDK